MNDDITNHLSTDQNRTGNNTVRTEHNRTEHRPNTVVHAKAHSRTEHRQVRTQPNTP